MGRYDILLEQDNKSKEPQTPATVQPRLDAPQQGSPPPTLTKPPARSPSTPRSLPVPKQPLERTPERPNGRTPTRTPERSPQRRIATYIEHARRVERAAERPLRGRKPREERRRPPEELRAIRQWAREKGLQVSDRGRIAADIVAKYDAAH